MGMVGAAALTAAKFGKHEAAGGAPRGESSPRSPVPSHSCPYVPGQPPLGTGEPCTPARCPVRL